MVLNNESETSQPGLMSVPASSQRVLILRKGRTTDEPHDLEYYLRCAREAIHLHDFELARRSLVKALGNDPKSPQAMNLVGVMLEMRGEFAQAGRCHGKVFQIDAKLESPRQNKWRIFKLFHFGIHMEHS